MTLTRRAALASTALLPFAAHADVEVLAGVSAPMTGPNARYGAQWKRGFDLALELIDNLGGAAGRPLQYAFQDTQSDPNRALAAARTFVGDPRVLIVLDGGTAAERAAASPTYVGARLVQLALTVSDPGFARAGETAWSLAPGEAEGQSALWEYAAALGLRRPAVLYPDTEAGRSARDAFGAATPGGAAVAAAEGYTPDGQDFRPVLARVGSASADALVLLSNYADGALICHQARDGGSKLPILAGPGNDSAEFLSLGGSAAAGVFVLTTFFALRARPEAENFVRRFQAKYSMEPDASNALAYDAMVLFSRLVQGWGPTREAMEKGLREVKDVPRVVYGALTFDPDARRVRGAAFQRLVVRDNRFTLWDGARPT